MAEAELELVEDCTRCAGLCCVAHAFEKTQSFGHEKDAGTPCRHLTADHRCAIHNKRDEQGYKGCGSYTCYGAGQRVTQQMFAGMSWLDKPDMKDDMMRAFLAMRRVHEALVMLQQAEKLTLPSHKQQELRDLQTILKSDQTADLEKLEMLERGALHRSIREFLVSLREFVPPVG